MAEKNYYLILGVSPETSGDRIRSAFRRLAKEHHPDKAGGERTAYFQEIAEAYEILSDPERRGNYNRKIEEEKTLRDKKYAPRPDLGKASEKAGHPTAMSGFPTRNISEDFFDDSFFSESFFPERERQFRRSDVLEFDAYLTTEEAFRGERVELEIPVPKTCPECRGTGSYSLFYCPACEGTGEYRTKEIVRIDFPPGILPETTLRATAFLHREKYLHLMIHVHIIRSVI